MAGPRPGPAALRHRHAIVAVACVLLVADAYGRGPAARSHAPGRHAARQDAAAVRPERLRYRATWNALPVATGELLVQPTARGDAVALRGRADTNEVLDLLWQMRDTFEATVRLAPVRPDRFVLRQNENGRRRETTIVARPPRLVATVDRRHRRTRHADVALTPSLHDPASVAYAIRGLPTDGGQSASYEILAGTKVYALTVTLAAREHVELAGRDWSALRYHLALQLLPRDVADPTDGAPDDEDARREQWRELKVQEAELWVSAGPERLPLRMRGRTFWGWVTVELVSRAGSEHGF